MRQKQDKKDLELDINLIIEAEKYHIDIEEIVEKRFKFLMSIFP